jgi:SAM-dependent methyltransferase
MAFRQRFDCLWCGRAWEVRGPDDLEGWAKLCPDCLGKADDNGFLRARLRAGLRDRAAAAAARSATVIDQADTAAGGAAATKPGAAFEDWYLRRGRFSRGPLRDGPWSMELEDVTRWLDAQPLGGTIVELGAGSGWWSGLLAEKGELWLYDADGDALELARQRLVAHGLLAHIHERDPLAPADKQVQAVVAAYLLGGASDEARLAGRLASVAAWLQPGGSFCFIEAAPAAADTSGPVDGPAGPLWPRPAELLQAILADAGLEPVEVRQTASSFVVGRAVAGG